MWERTDRDPSFRKSEEGEQRVWVDRGIDGRLDDFLVCQPCNDALVNDDPRSERWHPLEDLCPDCRSGFQAHALAVDLFGLPRPLNGVLENRVLTNDESAEGLRRVFPEAFGYFLSESSDRLLPGAGDEFQPRLSDRYSPEPGDRFLPGPGDGFQPGLGDRFLADQGDYFLPPMDDYLIPGRSDGFQPGASDRFLPSPGDGFQLGLNDRFLPDPGDAFMPDASNYFLPGMEDYFLPE